MINKEDIETQQKIAKITTGDVVIRLNDNNKSMLEIGNIKVYNIKKFNWLQRKMFKVFFGIKINNLKNKGE